MSWLNRIKSRPLQRFFRIRRAWLSLAALIVLIAVSFVGELWINNRALVVHYNGETYFPTFKFYPGTQFGQEAESEADYRALARATAAAGDPNWVVMPFVPYNAVENDFSASGEPPYPPSAAHWLGTDDRGRDVLARLVYGFRISIWFALLVTLIANFVGIGIGAFLGYFGGRFDLLFQRLIEIWSTVPELYLIITLAAIFEPTFMMFVVVMVAFKWIFITFYVRTETYRERSRDYIVAARALGAGHLRIITRHLIPNSLTTVITHLPFAVVAGISMITALDFLGYGLPPPTPSWGEMMKQALEVQNQDKLWLSLSPFLALATTLILTTFVGEGVREALDPKVYSRYD